MTIYILKAGNEYHEDTDGRLFAYPREHEVHEAARKAACGIVEVDDDPTPLEEEDDFIALQERAEAAEEWVEKTEELLRKKLDVKSLCIEDLLKLATTQLPHADDPNLHSAMCAWLGLDPKTTTTADLVELIP